MVQKKNAFFPINPVLDMFLSQQNKLFSSSSLSDRLQGCEKSRWNFVGLWSSCTISMTLEEHGIKVSNRFISCIITSISLFTALHRILELHAKTPFFLWKMMNFKWWVGAPKTHVLHFGYQVVTFVQATFIPYSFMLRYSLSMLVMLV